MAFSKIFWVILLTLTLLSSGCVSTPSVDREKAGLLAGVRFLETHPGEIATYSVRDPGGDAYLVYFNITSEDGVQTGFAEYYVDRFSRDVYVSSNFATILAIDQSPRLDRLFNRYPHAKYDGTLIKSKKEGQPMYVWQIRVVADGVDLGDFSFDANEEKFLRENLDLPPVINVRPS
jgi:hypothetical protein